MTILLPTVFFPALICFLLGTFLILIFCIKKPKKSKRQILYFALLLFIATTATVIVCSLNHRLGVSYGRSHPFDITNLKQGVIYEVVGKPERFKGEETGTLTYVFLSKNGESPKAYYRINSPPQRFIMIINGEGYIELLARPLPEDDSTPNTPNTKTPLVLDNKPESTEPDSDN